MRFKLEKNFKFKKRYVIAIVFTGFCVFILVGAKHRSDVRKLDSNTSTEATDTVFSEDASYMIDKEEIDSIIEKADSIPSENNGIKSDEHSRESIDTMLGNNKVISDEDREYKTLTIGGSGDALSPAVVAGDLDKYRAYAMVQISNAQVVDFVDKSVFGQTLVQLAVPIEGGKTQYVFYGCTDTLELSNQLDKYKYINVVGNAEDMLLTDVKVNDKNSYSDALVVLGTFSRVYE